MFSRPSSTTSPSHPVLLRLASKKAFRAVVLAKRLPRSSSAVSSFVRIYANSASDVAFLLRKSFVVKQSTIKLVASRPPRGAVQEQDVRPAAAQAGASTRALQPPRVQGPIRTGALEAMQCDANALQFGVVYSG